MLNYLKTSCGKISSTSLLLALVFSAQAGLKDPTQPADYAAQFNPPTLIYGVDLTAIFTSSLTNAAVINGEIYHVGDAINHYKITAIDPQVISLERYGETTKLPLVSPSVRDSLPQQEQN